MALSLPVDIPQRDLLQEITFGVVLFTLLVQGMTVGWVVDRTIGTAGSDGLPEPTAPASDGAS
jgi:CPA1 family monovalent cation:H+ antiporter